MRLLTLFFVVQRSLQPACCGSTQTRWPSCAANGSINIGMDLALLSGPSCEGDIAMHSRACTTLSVFCPPSALFSVVHSCGGADHFLLSA